MVALKVHGYREGCLHHRHMGRFQERDQEAILSEKTWLKWHVRRSNISSTQGSIRDYVKEFSSLMLEAPGMNEEDLLFNFMDNLQSWVKQE